MAVLGVKQVSNPFAYGGGTSPQATQTLQQTQPAGNPQPTGGLNEQYGSTAVGNVEGSNTAVTPAYDPVAAAAKAKAAEDARRAAQLKGEITNIINSIKGVFEGRYGQLDASAGEQTGKLNDRFGTESQDVVRQVGEENQKVGAAYAGRGSFDSSYRGNSVDTVTNAGNAQVRDLGTELNENIGKVGGWVSQQKAGLGAEKGAMDTILSRIAEEADPNNLVQLRNSLDAKMADLQGAGANNNTAAQNASALASIAPSSARAVQLKTTLSQIVSGNADASSKAAIGQRLIQSAQLSPEEQQALLTAFQGDLSAPEKQQETV